MNLPCCYTREDRFISGEVYTCDARRMQDLPMCQRHMFETFREAIIDGTLPHDVWVALARETEHMMTVREMALMHGVRQDARETRAEVREQQRQERQLRTNVVYYVALTGDRVKIGTTTHLANRMRTFRARGEDLLALEPGGTAVEAQRHRQFAHLRISGQREEFRRAPELEEHIARVGFDLTHPDMP